MAAPTQGEILECRVARLYARQGYFVRRRVDVERWFSPEKLQVTDIDVYVFDFDVDLALRRTVGECKSGTGKTAPKPAELMLSLNGLRALTGAEGAALFTSSRATPRLRQLAEELSMVFQDLHDLDRREEALGIDEHPFWGPHDPELVLAEVEIRKTTRKDRDLERAYWFLRSNFWSLDQFAATKRSVALLDALAKRWVAGLSPEEDRAIAWLVTDAVTAFSLACLMLARSAILWPEKEFRERLMHGLASGAASVEEMRKLSKSIDRYMFSMLEKAGAPPRTLLASAGAFEPRPPQYAESLAELLARLAADPAAARDLTKTINAVMTHRFKQGAQGLPPLSHLRVFNPDATMALARQVIAFLQGHLKLPERVGAAFRGDQSQAQDIEPSNVEEAKLPLDSESETTSEKAESGQISTPDSADAN